MSVQYKESEEQSIGGTMESRLYFQTLPPTTVRVSSLGVNLDQRRSWHCRTGTCKISKSTFASSSPAAERGEEVAASASRAACMALTELRVNATLRTRREGTMDWQVVASTITDLDWRQRIGLVPTHGREPVMPSDFHMFYLLTPRGEVVQQSQLRRDIVANATAAAGGASIGVFEALYWEDWDTVRRFFAAMRLPNRHMMEQRGMRNRRGKYARWGSLLLCVSYAVQFRIPYLVLFEDDSVWPSAQHVRDVLTEAARKRAFPQPSSRRVVKLSKWGEGYIFPLAAAKHFLSEVYKRGIVAHSDTFIRDFMDVVYYWRFRYKLMVWPNRGNIHSTPYAVNAVDFNYSASWNDVSPLLTTLQSGGDHGSATSSPALFSSKTDLSLPIVARRVADTRLIHLPPLPHKTPATTGTIPATADGGRGGGNDERAMHSRGGLSKKTAPKLKTHPKAGKSRSGPMIRLFNGHGTGDDPSRRPLRRHRARRGKNALKETISSVMSGLIALAPKKRLERRHRSQD